MKIDIAYIVSHGFAARMVMQTNLLGKFVEKGISVALIAPDKEDANLKKYCSEHNIQLYQFSPHSNFWSSNYARARMYFLENINKNPALLEKYIYAKRSSNSIALSSRIKTRIFKIGHDLKEVFPFIKTLFLKRELKMLNSHSAKELIEELNPKILVSTYPVNYSEAMLMYAAKSKGLKTVMHLLSWDNISCKGHFPILADEYIAWGPIMRDELKEYYDVKDTNIHNTGVPHFDLHTTSKKDPQHEKYLMLQGLDPKKPYLFFGMSSPRFAPKEIDIVEYLASQIQNDVYGSELQLVVRPHPQNIQGSMSDTSWLPRLEKMKNSRIAIDIPKLAKSKMPWSMEESDMYKLSHLLAGARLSLNSGSTLSIDSMMCGTPVILTSFDGDAELSYWMSARRLIDYNHLKKLTNREGVITCDSYYTLESSIKDVLKNREAVSNTISKSVQQFCPTTGNATESVISSLISIVEKQSKIVTA